MKFLCVDCDEVMSFVDRELPGDGTMAAVYVCPKCKREMALLTNPMETQLVSGLGIKVGGSTVPDQPLEVALSTGALADAARVEWSSEARARLENVPSFVRGMVKRIYTDYARERAIVTITPAVMDQARSELGLEGM